MQVRCEALGLAAALAERLGPSLRGASLPALLVGVIERLGDPQNASQKAVRLACISPKRVLSALVTRECSLCVHLLQSRFSIDLSEACAEQIASELVTPSARHQRTRASLSRRARPRLSVDDNRCCRAQVSAAASLAMDKVKAAVGPEPMYDCLLELRGFDSRWRDCHSAAPPSSFSRRFNMDREGASAK